MLPPSKIKSLWIQIPGYRFFHSPSGIEKRNRDPRLIGRKLTKKKLRGLICNSQTYSGTYLVTGFRGMGKTSLVRQVLSEIKEDPQERTIIEVESSLAQDDVNELHILKSLAHNVLKQFDEHYRRKPKVRVYHYGMGMLGLISGLASVSLLSMFLMLLGINVLGVTVKNDQSELVGWAAALSGVAAIAFPTLVYRTKYFWPIFFARRNFGKGYLIIKRLRELLAQIDAQVTSESHEEIGAAKTFFSFGRRRQETKFPLGPRDIEKELIEILKDITQKYQYQFVMVFDELDKIDPGHNPTIYEKENEEPLRAKKEFYAEEKVRVRREAIQKLFSNMKHFLTVAEAKFIFIAGREMYDAALADTSNRDSFINSIFHDVIYVGSFLTESYRNRSSDITHLPEKYLCQFLLSERQKERYRLVNGKEYGDNLKCYYQYMVEVEQLGDQLARKTVFLLQNFIIYLTYRSNGAPKKITRLFEDAIRSKTDREVLETAHKSHHVGDFSSTSADRRYFLYFNSEDQYRFNLNAKIFIPFLVTRSRNMRNYGDKLLIASTYILDHLYKFHKSAFAWSNLELTPEIIAINKAPELRGFIREIISDLEINQLSRINSGLFDFRFNKVVAQEIGYLSKTFQEESAAYNFTLDESLDTKRHYRRKLEGLNRANAAKPSGDKVAYYYSVGFVNAMLGDLHYYDQEYDEAILHYNESLEVLMAMETRELIRHKDYVVIYLRTALKLGLTYEKMNHYSYAFATYRTVSDKILAFGGITFLDFGSSAGAFDNAETLGYLKLIYQTNLAKLALFEKTGLNGIVEGDIARSDKEFELIFRNNKPMLLENPILRMEFLSKQGDILFYKNSFFWSDSMKQVDGDASDYFRQYLKRQFPEIIVTEFKEQGLKSNHFRAPQVAMEKYVRALGLFHHFLKPDEHDKKKWERLGTYIYATNDNDQIKPDQNLLEDTDFILKGATEYLLRYASVLKNPNKSTSVLRAFANTLSRLGDGFLSCGFKNEVNGLTKDIDKIQLIQDLIFLEKGENKRVENLIEHIGKIETNQQAALCCYRLAAGYFEKANDIGRRAFEFRKILYTVRHLVALADEKDRSEWVGVVKVLETSIVPKILRSNYKASRSAGRVENLLYEELFGDNFYSVHEKDEQHFNNVLKNISTSADSFTCIILLQNIKMKIEPRQHRKRLLLDTDLVSNQYNRYLALNHQLYIHHDNFLEFGKGNVNRDLQQTFLSVFKQPGYYLQGNAQHASKLLLKYNSLRFEELLDITLDAVYCCAEVIKILNVWGVSPALGYSHLAFIHEKLGDWVSVLVALVEETKRFNTPVSEREIWKRAKEAIGTRPKEFLDFNYHYEIALTRFYDALNTHAGGDSYKRIIENMFYLEDDYADAQHMFGTAIERLQVNTGVIAKRIESTKQKIESTTKLYSFESYSHIFNE